jgi:hypothetical protein
MYNRYLNDKGGILYSTRDSLDLLRLYGKGAQPSDIYKSMYQERVGDNTGNLTFTQQRNEKTRQGWENIAWRVISPLPRIKTIIKGYLDNVGQDVFVDAVDSTSNDDKENLKWKMHAVAQNYEFLSEYHMKAGIPMEELQYLPANETELNLFEAMGGFKLNYARAMEKLIRHTEQISDVDEDLKDRWIDDSADLGVVSGRLVWANEINKYKYRYIDPKYLVIQYVKDNDYSRSEWAGYVERYTVSELKQIMPDKPEDFFKNIAYRYRGKFGNRGKTYNWNEFDNFSKHSNKDGAYNYDDFVVEVLESEWIDYKAERHLVYTNVRGRKSIHKLSKMSEINELSKSQKRRGASQKDLKTKMRKLRGAKWIIGTDVVFDYGLVNMVDRPKMTEVMHSFKLFTLRDLPLTEQLIPIADDMAIAWYRWQDDRNMLQRSGYSIDVGMMENLDIGGGDFGFIDVLKAWRDTRYLFHQQSLSGKYEGGTTTPVQPIESLVLAALQEFITTWEAALKRVEDVTGLNLVMLGATAPSGSQVTTTQMSAASAVHVLKPIIKVIGRIKNELAETAMRRLQLAFKARADIADVYTDVVGKADVAILKQAEKDAVQYGLTFVDKPSEEMKADLIAGAQLSLNNRRDGRPGITESQYFHVVQSVHSGGNLKELFALIDYLTMKSQQEIEEKQQQNIQMQNEGLAKIEQQKMQGQQAAQQQKTQGEVAVVDRKGQWEMAKLNAEKGGAEPTQTPT